MQFLADPGPQLLRRRRRARDEAAVRHRGSHRSAPPAASRTPSSLLRDDTFLVISGDALTDIDLDRADRVPPRPRGAGHRLPHPQVPNPLEFGITIIDEDVRVQRFLEKPTWGQVFSDTVNTGIYVMEPEVLDLVPEGETVDWSADVFPKLLADGRRRSTATSPRATGRTSARHESYHAGPGGRARAPVKVDAADGFEVSPGVWVGEGAARRPGRAVLTGPLYIGDYAQGRGRRRAPRVLRHRQQRRHPCPRSGRAQHGLRQRPSSATHTQPAGRGGRQGHRDHAGCAARRGLGRR